MSEHIYGGVSIYGSPVIKLEEREEIVRCRDCTYYATDELGGYCTLLDFQDAQGMEDRFCAWAKRRDA